MLEEGKSALKEVLSGVCWWDTVGQFVRNGEGAGIMPFLKWSCQPLPTLG